MSMHPQPIGLVPKDLARVARVAFPKGTTCIRMRDVLEATYDDEDLAQLLEVRGRPAIVPWRLALVTVMQFAEGLSDRRAAQAVRTRLDWIVRPRPRTDRPRLRLLRALGVAALAEGPRSSR